MIDEAVLERALRDEADEYPIPPDGPADILAIAEETRERRPRRAPWLAAAAVVVAVTFGFQLVRQGGGFDGLPNTRSGGGSGSALTASDAGTKNAPDTASWTTAGDTVAKEQSYDMAAGGALDPKVVRTGEVWVEVGKDRARAVLDEAARIARAHGGFVASSEAAFGEGGNHGGSVVLRVPVKDFDAVVAEVGRLGTVRQSQTRGEDVGGQITDNAARLRSLTATRAQLQTLLARAKDVSEVLAVQERMSDVQTQIEQIQGRLAALEDSTTYGTVRLTLVAPGSPEERGGFSKAWHDAVDGFVGGFESLLGASGTIAFALILLATVLILGRAAYRRWFRLV